MKLIDGIINGDESWYHIQFRDNKEKVEVGCSSL